MPGWRTLSSQQLREASAQFQCPHPAKIEDIADAVGNTGLSDLISIQLSSSRVCTLTFLSTDSTEEIVDKGLFFGGKVIDVCHVLQPTLQLHISDLPIWISDSAAQSALKPYGEVLGTIRHGKTTTKLGVIGNGVRFATFRLQKGAKAIPSYLLTPGHGGHSFSIRYTGQPRTCRLCSSVDHLAAACPERKRPKAMSYARTVQWAGSPANVEQPQLTISTDTNTESDVQARHKAQASAPVQQLTITTDTNTETPLESPSSAFHQTNTLQPLSGISTKHTASPPPPKRPPALDTGAAVQQHSSHCPVPESAIQATPHFTPMVISQTVPAFHSPTNHAARPAPRFPVESDVITGRKRPRSYSAGRILGWTRFRKVSMDLGTGEPPVTRLDQEVSDTDEELARQAVVDSLLVGEADRLRT